jgi:hypothetical protein
VRSAATSARAAEPSRQPSREQRHRRVRHHVWRYGPVILCSVGRSAARNSTATAEEGVGCDRREPAQYFSGSRVDSRISRSLTLARSVRCISPVTAPTVSGAEERGDVTLRPECGLWSGPVRLNTQCR